MQSVPEIVTNLLGLGVEPKHLSFLQISLRGVVVFVASLLMMRVGSKRSLAQQTAFDTVLIVVLASVLARAVNGSAAFFATLGGAFVIVLLHRLLAAIACRWHPLGVLIKGRATVIFQNGELTRVAMRREHISDHDFDEDMRLRAETEDKSRIKTARVERSGEISFIKVDE